MTESEAIEQLKIEFIGEYERQREAKRIAIKALEKQIPKKVITPPCNTCEKQLCDCECKHFAFTYRDDYRCPTCDSNEVYMSEYEFRFDYCPNCGQKLVWGLLNE